MPPALFNSLAETYPAWREPFPEPRTIPSGWDLSGLLSTTSDTVDEEAALLQDDDSTSDSLS